MTIEEWAAGIPAPANTPEPPNFPGFGDLGINPDLICEILEEAGVITDALASMDPDVIEHAFPVLRT